MKRMVLLLAVGAMFACGGDSTAPSGNSDKFDGTWSGNAVLAADDTLHFVLISVENDSSFTGTGTVNNSTDTLPTTFTGTSTPPAVAIAIDANILSFTYSGNYVTSDSVAGFLTVGDTSVAMDLKKQ